MANLSNGLLFLGYTLFFFFSSLSLSLYIADWMYMLEMAV